MPRQMVTRSQSRSMYTPRQSTAGMLSNVASTINSLSQLKRKLSVASSKASSYFSSGQPQFRARSQSLPKNLFSRRSSAGNLFAKKAIKGLSTGYYKGKIKTRRKRAKMELTKEKFMATGCCQSIEIYGAVSDPNCVYVGHSTHCLALFPSVIARALVRKLIAKAGIDIDNDERILNLDYDSTSIGHSIVLYGTQLNATAGQQGPVTQVMRYDMSGAVTLKSLTENFSSGASLITIFANIIQSTNNTTDWDNLDRIELLARDTSVIDSLEVKATINLRQYKVSLMSSSMIKVQNRSKGAASGDVDATAVDNQPLRGLLYELNTGNVASKNNGTLWNMDMVSHRGTIKKTAADFTGTLGNPWKEPQPAKVFNRCAKSAHVRLQPGDIKTASIKHVYSGSDINDLLFKLTVRSNNFAPGTRGIQRASGKCQFFALEELINTGGNNNIDLQFEIDKIIGCTFTKVNKPLMLINHEEFIN